MRLAADAARGVKRALPSALVLAVALCSAARAEAAGVPAQLSEAESHALAQTVGANILEAFVPPPGAVPSATEPPRAGPAPTPIQVETDIVTLRRWWVTSATPGQVIADVVAHPPAGGQVQSEGNFEGSPPMPGIPTLPTDVDFAWPGVPRARGRVRLEASATRLASGATAIEADVQSFWLTPRSPAEAIPPGNRLLRISVLPYADGSPSGRTRQRPLWIGSMSRIEHVATLVNALPLSQARNFAAPCPQPQGVVLRLAFYRAARTAPDAVVRDNLVDCVGVQLELNGHEEPTLEEGWQLPPEISKAIGMKLDTGSWENTEPQQLTTALRAPLL